MMVIYAGVGVILFCELGETIRNQFELYNEELNRCNWYLYSLKMQRMILTFVSITQQSTVIRGYGNKLCARVTAKEVIQ